ncbi:MAG: competence/damage-inducible protein A [Fimbriimonadaceae bacterium]|nr:competence/damage-inducible protein A [Fimbriimonadaceae bacterium]
MTAEIVSVGTEILMGQIVDTNAQHLGQLLPEFGIVHRYRQTVGDNAERLAEALKLALSRADIVFTIGGLGPTEDDLTRDGIAAALQEELILDKVLEERLRKLFALRNLPWMETQIRQAMLPPSAEPIKNPNGTAPGLICQKDGKIVIALPGPRGEFVPMVDGPVHEFLTSLAADEVIRSRFLKVVGMGESIVEDRLRDLMSVDNPSVAPYAKPGEVHLRLTAKASNKVEADMMLRPLEAEIRSRIGDAIFGKGNQTLEEVILELLRKAKQTLSVAESCTGGGLGSRLTNVPGSSDVFVGGIISYANEVKTSHLDVHPAMLSEGGPGAVSAECAEAMAQGAAKNLKTDWSLSITGIAGPGGATPGKPVGLVYIGLQSPRGVQVEEHRFRGDRSSVRERSVLSALSLLWRELKHG